MTNYVVVFVTAGAQDEATRIAEVVVTERLAACVNMIPEIRSVYQWEGKLCNDQEILLVIKTTQEAYNRLEARIKELHSYATPEIIAVNIERGSGAYLAWIADSVDEANKV